MTELTTVEQPVIDLLVSLGRTHLPAEGETFPDSKMGRETSKEVVMKDILLQSLKKINPDIPEQYFGSIVKRIMTIGLNKDVVHANREMYKLMRDGIKTEVNSGGGTKTEIVRLIDFTTQDNNSYHVVDQLWIQGDVHRRKPDLLCYVNGIPLINIENKDVIKSVRDAFDENLQVYRDEIPQLYRYSAYVILSNGMETKMGAFSSSWQFFKTWKRVDDERVKGDTNLETAIRGLCQIEYVLDILENFCLFEEVEGKLIKIVPQNHQYLGVNNAYHNVQIRDELDGKLGVYRHTQGSGKSFSMCFLANKVLRKEAGDFTFVVITDRTNLDDQIYGQFVRTGMVKVESNRAKDSKQAQSIKHLRELLKGNERFIFTTLHKFDDKELDVHPIITDRDDVIVMTDEAHRTQNGQLALNMRNAIPNAKFIAFTGTPLLDEEDTTRSTFGKDVSVYNFRRAIEDGATVRVFYQNRVKKLSLSNLDISEDALEIYEKHDLDDDQAEKFSKEFSSTYKVITRDDRLDKIANDIARHYIGQADDFKAMVVSVDIPTTMRMYEKVDKVLKKMEGEIKERLVSPMLSRYEKAELETMLAKIEKLEMHCVVSKSQKLSARLKPYDIDIDQHFKMSKDSMKKLFKKSDSNFRLAFVCNMWLTGFDVKSLRTLYVDKPMGNHNLMQAIARTNRVYEADDGTVKQNGLVLLYLPIAAELQKAYAKYAQDIDGETDTPLKDTGTLVELIEESYNQIVYDIKELCDVDITGMKSLEGKELLMFLEKVTNAVVAKEQTKNDTRRMLSQFISLYESLLPDEEANAFTSRYKDIKKLHLTITKSIDSNTDVSAIKEEMEKLLDASISTEDYELAAGGKLIDISSLDPDLILASFEGDNKHSKAQRTVDSLKRKIDELGQKNPAYLEFGRKLNDTLLKYNAGSLVDDEYFTALVKHVKDFDDYQKETVSNGLTEEQRAIFDLLFKDGITKKDELTLRSMSKELYQELVKANTKIIDWKNNEEGRAKVYQQIRDYLYDKIPVPTYTEPETVDRSKSVYQYAYEH